MAAEFNKITSTSALLQELAGGKLAATICFCRRAAQDAKGQGGKNKNKKNGMGVSQSAAAVMEQLQRLKQDARRC